MYQHVKHFKLNPKAITMNQLYGAFDPNTREFIDGVLPNLYRNAAADKEFLLEVCCYRIARELNVIALFLTLAKIGENNFQ